MTTTLKRNLLLTVIVAVNLAADQITKYIARLHLILDDTPIDVVGTLFQLVLKENDGAFLGLGSTLPQPLKTYVLVLFPAIAIIAGFLYLILGKNVSLKQAVCVACIIGGGIGNVWDRAVHSGSVTDFLYFGIGPSFRTGVLNVADLSITFGAIFLLLFQYKEDKLERTLKSDS